MGLNTFEELEVFLRESVAFNGHSVSLRSRRIFTEHHLDRLAYESVFHADPAMRSRIRWVITRLCAEVQIYPASMQSLYEARAGGDLGPCTVPVLNLPTLTYDLARAVFRAAARWRAGSFIFGLSRAELDTTGQTFEEYAGLILAAALRERWQGPVFLQAGPLQADARRFATQRAGEMSALRYLLEQAVQAGLYNIDLDLSTLADPNRPTPNDQLFFNYSWTAELTAYIRRIEPRGVTISMGAEIGGTGERNSTEDDLNAFLSGYEKVLFDTRYGAKGISKIAVQTRALAYGVPLSDGRILPIHLDLNALRRLSQLARSSYGLAGAVQRGAAELPWESFDRFPAADAAEIHLAAEIQDVIIEGLHAHSSLQEAMDRFLKREYAAEWPADMSEAYFLHRMRSRAWREFKKPLWDLPAAARAALAAPLESALDTVFTQCRVDATRELVHEHTAPLSAKP